MSTRFQYKNRTVFYRKGLAPSKPYKVNTSLHKPSLGVEANPRFVANESKDLRQRENLDLLESMRNPREKDYYQDHTYHDQWEQRDMDDDQRAQLTNRYYYFAPGFQVNPWIWHPGDIVEVIDGPFQGQRGSIIAVVPYKNEIIVQNINVKDVVVPGGDGRPEQIVQREHPIICTLTKHVDPSTGRLCDLKIIKVRGKKADDAPEDAEAPIEERRISMQTGTVLPIPPRTAASNVETGDPLRDTPYQDALETTYETDKEMAVLVERKLAALEEHFVNSLKQSYNFHNKRQRDNAAQMRQFQKDALVRAVSTVTDEMNAMAENLDDWWFEELAPHMEIIEQEKAQKLEADAKKRAALADAAQKADEAALAAEAEYEEEEVDEDGDDSDEAVEDVDAVGQTERAPATGGSEPGRQ